MRKNWLIDRRTVLKGMSGLALGLPLLEAMGWAETPKAGGAYKPPVRLGFVYHACGVWIDAFWPKDPATYPVTLPPTLEPLREVADQCLLLDNVKGAEDGKPWPPPHCREISSWLTAAMPNRAKPGEIDLAISADQIAANAIGVYTPVPSLELAFRDNSATGLGEQGYNNRYYKVCNFAGPTQPLPVETSPANVYKRLFSSRQSRPRKSGTGPAADTSKFAVTQDGDGQSLDRSMLDLILGGAKDLRGNVGVADQRRLDEYLDSLRALEKRVDAIERQQAEAAREKAGRGKNSKAGFTSSPPIEVKVPSGPVKWSEHMRVMCDLMILAWQTDLTRVCTLIGDHVHAISFPEVGVNDSHHEISHNDNPDKPPKIMKVDRFAIEQYAYLITKMKSLKEGPGTLLDNCIVMWGSGMDQGWHSFKRLPTIIAGRGGGTIRTGRYAKANGNIGDLLMAILARAGVNVDKPIGCGTKLLAELA